MITFYFILLGYYAYIESSSPRKRGDKARLMTGPLKGVYCLRFAYNMHGRTIGQLNIYHVLHGSELNIWWRKGQQTIARQWKTDNVTVYGNNYYVSSLISQTCAAVGIYTNFWLLFFQRISPFAMLAYVSTVISTENSEQLKRLLTIFEFLKKFFDEEGQSTENWNIIGRVTCAKIESRNGYANCQSKDWEIPDNPLTCGIILFSSDWLSYFENQNNGD